MEMFFFRNANSTDETYEAPVFIKEESEYSIIHNEAATNGVSKGCENIDSIEMRTENGYSE